VSYEDVSFGETFGSRRPDIIMIDDFQHAGAGISSQ
jgi:hypothetical protein